MADRLSGDIVDLAISSDLERARDTALAILKHHPDIELEQWRCVREAQYLEKSQEPREKRQEEIVNNLIPKLISVATKSAEFEFKVLLVSHGVFLEDLHNYLDQFAVKRKYFHLDPCRYKNTAVSNYVLNIDSDSINDVICKYYACYKHVDKHE